MARLRQEKGLKKAQHTNLDATNGVPAPAAIDFRQALIETYTVNDRINQILLEHLDPGAWRASGTLLERVYGHG